MAQEIRMKAALALILAMLSMAVIADAECFRADADSGEMNFRGVAEGAPFSGFFEDFRVSICMTDLDLTTAEIEVRVATGSATVGNRQGDEALRSDEVFAPERFPEAIWTSTGIAGSDAGFEAQGELRLRDVRAGQPVKLRLEDSDDELWLSGSAEILRLDYQVGTGEFEDTEFVRNRVDLRFELQLQPAPDA